MCGLTAQCSLPQTGRHGVGGPEVRLGEAASHKISHTGSGAEPSPAHGPCAFAVAFVSSAGCQRRPPPLLPKSVEHSGLPRVAVSLRKLLPPRWHLSHAHHRTAPAESAIAFPTH